MEKLRKLKKVKRQRKHGFRQRTSSHYGKKIIKRRRQAKRKSLTI